MRPLVYALRLSLPLLGGLAAWSAPSASSPLSVATAEAGPLRRPRLHTLLVDLTHIGRITASAMTAERPRPSRVTSSPSALIFCARSAASSLPPPRCRRR